MTPPSLLSFRVKQPLSTTPHTRASYQKERRDKIKREKMERKRMYREKVDKKTLIHITQKIKIEEMETN